MAAQEEALTRGLQAVSARIAVLAWASAGSLLLASIAVVLALVL